MYGVFDINIGIGDASTNTKACNHLTRFGLQHVLKGKPPRTQSVRVPTANNYVFSNTLNYMFIILGTVDSPNPIADEDIYDLTISDLPEDVIWVDYGSTLSTLNQPIGPNEKYYIRGIGIGHKDVNGDPANDWIFSYANASVVIDNVYPTSVNAPKTYWTFTASYQFYTKTPTLPGIKVSIGGTTYKFVETPYTGTISSAESGFTSSLGYSNWTGPNIASMVAQPPGFTWAICGRPGVPSESFEEMIVEDPITRELTRVFKAVYFNKRPFDIDITGFNYKFGAQAFNYKCENDKYIRIPAGKRFELVFALDMAGEDIPTVNNPYYDFNIMPMLSSSTSTFSLKTNTYSNTLLFTQYEGTGKQITATVNTDITTPSAASWYKDELTKVQAQYKDGTLSAPRYVLGTKNPASYTYAAPSIVSTDGWVLNNGALRFALTVPAGITYVRFSLDDNIWTTVAVTAGTINYIELPLKFFYEGYMFVKWGNVGVTALIAYYQGRIVNTTESINIEPVVYKGQSSFAVVSYPSKQSVPYAWRWSSSSTLASYSNITRTAPGETYGPILAGLAFGTVYGAEILDTIKWFNPVTKTLDLAPAFAQVVQSVIENSTRTFLDVGARRPTQTVEIKTVPFNGTPRISGLTLVKTPTTAAPNTFKTSAITGATKIEVYNSTTNEVIKSIDTVPGGDYVVNITDKLYNHIDYGVRYLDINGNNLSLGLEYLFKGVSLAPPEPLTTVNYDAGTKTLTFTTPTRATRATISRWGFELFSFETIVGGTTSLYTTNAFDPAGRYVLTVYNSEGAAGTPYFLFGDVDDPAIKPETTGPYSFSDWSYTNSNHTSSAGLPFAKAKTFEDGVYGVKINGVVARVASISRNQYNLITSIVFEAAGAMVKWETGFGPNSTSYDNNSYTSSTVRLVGGPQYSVVDVWHEWLPYATIGTDKIGIQNSSGLWVASYGKQTNWYQFTEVTTGYVRNSVRLLLMQASNNGLRVPFETDSTLTTKTPYALIFPHTSDLVGSPFIGQTGNYYNHTRYQPFINGELATWDPTYLENGTTVSKLRAVTPNIVLVLDTADKVSGWVLEGMDPSKIGDPDYKDIAITFELINSSKYTYTNQLSTYPTYTGVNAGGTNPVRYKADYYIEQIFTRFYPYMQLMTYQELTGKSITQAPFSYSVIADYNNYPYYRWSEAYFQIDIKKLAEENIVILNGQVATVTTKTVTLPFVPGNYDLFSRDQFDMPPRSTWQNYNSPNVPGEYTYEAIVLTVDGLVISNDKHPKVLSILSNTLADPTARINMVFSRNKVLQSAFSFDPNLNSYNVGTGQSFTELNYTFHYTAVSFWPLYPKIVKPVDTVPIYENDDPFVPSPVLNSLWIISKGIRYGVTTSDTLSNLVKVNNESFDIVVNPNYITWLDDKSVKFDEFVFKLVNTSYSKQIVFYYEFLVDYIGFTDGESIDIEIGKFAEDSDEAVLTSINNWYVNVDDSALGNALNLWGPSSYGANRAYFWNYVPHVIPSGRTGLKFKFKSRLLASTVEDPNYVVPDRTEDMVSNYTTTYKSDYTYPLSNSFISKVSDVEENLDATLIDAVMSMKCNGITSTGAVVATVVDGETEQKVIKFPFPTLDIEVVFNLSTAHISFIDLLENDLLAREELYVFLINYRDLSLTNNDSIFGFEVYGDYDSPLYGVQNQTTGFFTDANGTERWESIYILTGKKPRVEVPIDDRINNDLSIAYGKDTFNYTNITSSYNSEE